MASMILHGLGIMLELIILCSLLGYFFDEFYLPHLHATNHLRSDPSFIETRVTLSDKNARSDFQDPSWDTSYKEAYSLWYLPPAKIAKPMKQLIDHLADQYNGTYHDPHVTLYGPIYSTDLKSLHKASKQLASSIPATQMNYNRIDVKAFRPSSRFRGGIAIRYEETPSFKKAAIHAASIFNHTDYQHPHTSLLYDHDGNSAEKSHLNESIVELFRMFYNQQFSSKESFQTTSAANLFSWKAEAIALVYTPLRDHFLNTHDIKTIVSRWRIIETYLLTGSSQQLDQPPVTQA
jgi:hypothetical protein